MPRSKSEDVLAVWLAREAPASALTLSRDPRKVLVSTMKTDDNVHTYPANSADGRERYENA